MDIRVIRPGPESSCTTAWWHVEHGALRVAMADWNRPASEELGAMLAHACEQGDAGGWPLATAERLQRTLTGADSPLDRGIAVAFAALSVIGDVARVAWAGDIRVAIDDGNHRWQTRDHTVANELRAKGMELPSEDGVVKGAIVRALGGLPSDPPEVASVPIGEPAAIVLCSNGYHGHDTGWSYLDSLVAQRIDSDMMPREGIARTTAIRLVLARPGR